MSSLLRAPSCKKGGQAKRPEEGRPRHAIKDAAGIEAEPERSLKSIEATASETCAREERGEVARPIGRQRRIRLRGFALGNGAGRPKFVPIIEEGRWRNFNGGWERQEAASQTRQWKW